MIEIHLYLVYAFVAFWGVAFVVSAGKRALNLIEPSSPLTLVKREEIGHNEWYICLTPGPEEYVLVDYRPDRNPAHSPNPVSVLKYSDASTIWGPERTRVMDAVCRWHKAAEDKAANEEFEELQEDRLQRWHGERKKILDFKDRIEPK